jgi:WD40 repeat protein
VYCAVFSPDGRRVVTTSFDLTARVWDVSTGKALTPLFRQDNLVRAAAFSPDGRRVATGGDGGTARVWDAATGRPLTPPLRQDGDIYFAAFSPDGRRLTTAGCDGSARVWQVGPDERPVGDLRAIAELRSVQQWDTTDALVPLMPDKWKARWDDLRKRYPADFRPYPERVYEEMNRPATQPAGAPATRPANTEAAP